MSEQAGQDTSITPGTKSSPTERDGVTSPKIGVLKSPGTLQLSMKSNTIEVFSVDDVGLSAERLAEFSGSISLMLCGPDGLIQTLPSEIESLTLRLSSSVGYSAELMVQATEEDNR